MDGWTIVCFSTHLGCLRRVAANTSSCLSSYLASNQDTRGERGVTARATPLPPDSLPLQMGFVLMIFKCQLHGEGSHLKVAFIFLFLS